MRQSIWKTIGALTPSDDEGRQFDVAAERIQSALLNVRVPSIAGLDLGIHAEPARLVGGDYIDVYARGEELLFGLGDASGKSLGAAVNALMLRYLLRGLLQAMGHERLETVMSHANIVVAEDLEDTDYFITLVVGTIDPRSGLLRVSNAGHEPPLILRSEASDVEVLMGHGMVLGIDPALHFAVQETKLLPGDRAVFYTDGLTEATNERGELYTVECLRENFLAHRGLTSQELAEALFSAVKAYSNNVMRDDATILVVHRL